MTVVAKVPVELSLMLSDPAKPERQAAGQLVLQKVFTEEDGTVTLGPKETISFDAAAKQGFALPKIADTFNLAILATADRASADKDAAETSRAKTAEKAAAMQKCLATIVQLREQESAALEELSAVLNA